MGTDAYMTGYPCACWVCAVEGEIKRVRASVPFSAAPCKSPRDALTAPGLFIKENDALKSPQRSGAFRNSNTLYPVGFIRNSSGRATPARRAGKSSPKRNTKL